MDLNVDGIIGSDESGLAGWTVFVDRNHDRRQGADEPATVTDSEGVFTVSQVWHRQPMNWKSCLRQVGSAHFPLQERVRSSRPAVRPWGRISV